ncbi:hypothetical protein HMPREF0670_01429 [Prevotella sp. oral taxon 317 str. F0108]|nr:hypothetical protein HMPREF0670_01429 [Prevotella sp. oral taxon 317 str. F0108]
MLSILSVLFLKALRTSSKGQDRQDADKETKDEQKRTETTSNN